MLRPHGLISVLTLCLVSGVTASAQTGDDAGLHRTCSHCGMDRGMFAFSRMLIECDDGTVMGLCSAHCAATDPANNIDRSPRSILAADFGGKQRIDAEKAFWAVGGNKPGVMSGRGKWAFGKKDDAERFITSKDPPAEPEDLGLLASLKGLFANRQRPSYRRGPAPECLYPGQVSSSVSWIPPYRVRGRLIALRLSGMTEVVKGAFPRTSNFWGAPAEAWAFPVEE